MENLFYICAFFCEALSRTPRRRVKLLDCRKTQYRRSVALQPLLQCTLQRTLRSTASHVLCILELLVMRLGPGVLGKYSDAAVT
eukprot:08922_1